MTVEIRVQTSIDSRGMKGHRQRVNQIMRQSNAGVRLARAEVKRRRKALKRATGGKLVLFAVPPGGVAHSSPDGAYIWRGNHNDPLRYQMIVAGLPLFSVEQYLAAAEAWSCDKLIVEEMKVLEPGPDADEKVAKAVKARGFLSIILRVVEDEKTAPASV